MAGTPHDALVKATFSQVEHAADLFRTSLPPELVTRLDLGTLALCPGSFVDEALRKRFTDLLYSVELAGRPAFLYLLLEHQSTVDPLLVLRLWRYMGEIWQGYVRENGSTRVLPVIIPMVLHHSATGWGAPTFLGELFELDADTRRDLAPYLPALGFVLEDLSAHRDHELRARVMSAMPKLVLWALTHARDADGLLDALRDWTHVIHETLEAPNGVASLALVLRYILEVSEVEPGAIEAFLAAEIDSHAKETYMTGAEILRQQGREEGLREGHEKGRADAMRTMLSKLIRTRFGALPGFAAERIARATPDELEHWAERLLSAPTLEGVFEHDTRF